MNNSLERYTLIAITGFAAVSAIAGGIGVVTSNGLGMPQSWLQATPFADYVVPGLILAIVVGGSALVATVLLLMRHAWQYVVTFCAGGIMVGWIVGEVFLIQQASRLQALYLVVGLALMGLSAMIGLRAAPDGASNLLHTGDQRHQRIS